VTTVGPIVLDRRAARTGGRRRYLRLALPLLPVVVLAERAWSVRWVADDGFITLRVVQQLLDGNGPVYNAGERVEASTSTLWVFVLALGDLVLPFRLERVAVVLGLVLTIGGLVLATLAARSLCDGLQPGALLVPAGAAVLVAVKPVWIFTTSGLEGGLITAWLGGTLWLLVRWGDGGGRLPWWGAVVLGLGPLIRPDLAVFSAVSLGVVLAASRRDGWPAAMRLLAWALGLPVAYQIFRMGYYGLVMPNPGVTKEAGLARRDLGWRYLGAFVGPYLLWLPLLVLAVGAYVPLVRDLRRRRRTRSLLVVAAFVAGGVVHALYIVRVGGDFIESRLLLPPFFALIAPVAVVPLRRSHAVTLLVLPWAAISLLFLRSSVDDVIVANDNPVTIGDYGWGPRGGRRASFQGDGVYYHGTRLSARPADGRHVVFGAYGIGVSGFALGTDVYVLDLLGLADSFTSHLRIDERGLPGHEKPLPPPWIAARATAPGSTVDESELAASIPLVRATSLGGPDPAPFDERVAVARSTLECKEMREFFAVSSGRLTPRRFLRNVAGAFGNTMLRIEPRPDDAAAQFCD